MMMAMHPLTLLCVGMYGETFRIRMARRCDVFRGNTATEHQIHRENKVSGKRTPDHLNLTASNEYGFYSKRESECGSSALEPGDGAPARRALEPQDADVQRYGDEVASLIQRHDLKKYH